MYNFTHDTFLKGQYGTDFNTKPACRFCNGTVSVHGHCELLKVFESQSCIFIHADSVTIVGFKTNVHPFSGHIFARNGAAQDLQKCSQEFKSQLCS